MCKDLILNTGNKCPLHEIFHYNIRVIYLVFGIYNVIFDIIDGRASSYRQANICIFKFTYKKRIP